MNGPRDSDRTVATPPSCPSRARQHDLFVPFQHCEWLAARIPGVDAHLTERHVSLIQRRIPELRVWLLERC